MTRTDLGAAINARIVPTVEYDADPRGLRRFTGLSAVLQRGIRGRAGTPVVKHNEEWNGYAVAPQQFTGMAPLGNARAVTNRTATLSDERSASALTDPALALFADRLRRGR